MSAFAYLAALLVSLGGLGLLDRRYRLAVFDRPRAALLTLGATVGMLLLWDLIGVGLGIFFVGPSTWLTGIRIAPEVPLEEPVFLTLLAYQTLLLWRWLDRRERPA
ncbi:lycopene cyclase domain-containing protein [Demequina gelatinilytica]|uniref:lycopene cyclase domain-containing protein n=1 Tax=Demequina gelatinilytica TaxID=1638980 RepID=UPI00078050D8|nr:lycopene cyclase domain-containing protein [Demequina gelatinilytica]